MVDSTPDVLIDALGLTPEAIAERLLALEINADTRADLKQSWSCVQHDADQFITDLYRRFRAVPEMADLLANEARMTRLRAAQFHYLNELFCSELNREYVMRRLAIGLTHHRLRVTPQWYLASITHFLCSHVELLLTTADSRQHGIQRITTLFRSLMFDVGLALNAYGWREDAKSRAIGTSTFSRDTFQTREGIADAAPVGRLRELTISRIHLDNQGAGARAAFLGLDQSAITRLHNLEATVQGAIPRMLSSFYDFVTCSPALSAFVPPALIERLLRQVGAYWRELFTTQFDRPHSASCMRVGVIHERIGLNPQWYLIGLTRQTVGILQAIPLDHPELAAVIRDLFRAIFFDVTFVIDAYMEARAESIVRADGYANRLMSGLTSAVVVVDAISSIRYANDRFLSMIGIEPGMLYGMRFADVIPFPLACQLVAEVTGSQLDRKTDIGTWGGGIFRVTVMKLSDSQESLGLPPMAVVFDDVTELVRLSGTIEQDNERYRRMADAVPVVLWELDESTDTLVTVSRQSVDLTGYRDVMLMGRPHAWTECIQLEDRAMFHSACKAVEPGSHGVCEYRLIRADNRQIWLRSLFRRSHIPGAPLAAVTFDVTMTRLNDKQRQTAMSQLVGGVAHVVNNALTVIIGNIELHEFKNASSGFSEFLVQSSQAARRVADTMAHLQAYSGAQLLHPRRCRLSEWIQEWTTSLREWLGPEVQLLTQLESTEGQVDVDVDLLQIAVRHLCQNARQAMPHGGRVTIEIRNVEASEPMDPPDRIRAWTDFIVRDTGVGMSDIVRRRAIEPFFSTKSPDLGSGLGLSFVHGFLSQSGGRLILESVPGEGSEVTMRFPRVAAKEQTAVIHSPGNNASVLLVEDDTAIRELTVFLLQRLGYEVYAVGSYNQALDVVEKNVPGLLLTDVLLGEGLTGIDLARNLMQRLPELRIVIMSGYAADHITALDIPSSWEMLPKPFTLTQLGAVLRRAKAAT